ncbi:MAG: hypothetical protein HFE30_06395 [Clostridiales bacterium]|nr:hypothetical protein [Clostridiales bacterium]
MRKYSVLCVLISSLFILSGCAENNIGEETIEERTGFSANTVENSDEIINTEMISDVTTTLPDVESVTVYITNSGKKYHCENCQFLTYSKIPVDLNTLDTDFYKPCAVCCP